MIFHQCMDLAVFTLLNFVDLGPASKFQNLALLFHFFLELGDNVIRPTLKVLAKISDSEGFRVS